MKTMNATVYSTILVAMALTRSAFMPQLTSQRAAKNVHLSMENSNSGDDNPLMQNIGKVISSAIISAAFVASLTFGSSATWAYNEPSVSNTHNGIETTIAALVSETNGDNVAKEPETIKRTAIDTQVYFLKVPKAVKSKESANANVARDSKANALPDAKLTERSMAQELESMKDDLEKAMKEVNAKEAEIEKLNGQIRKLKTEVKDLKGNLEASKDEIESVKKLLESSKTEINDTKNVLATTKKELSKVTADSNAKIELLEKDLAQSTLELNEMKSKKIIINRQKISDEAKEWWLKSNANMK